MKGSDHKAQGRDRRGNDRRGNDRQGNDKQDHDKQGYGMYLRSSRGADRFGEAYPLGNGQIGAMVYGGAPANRIGLSENTFFSGRPFEDNNREGAAEAFRQMREAAVKKDYARVHELAEGFIGRKNNYGTNLPVGDLRVEYEREGEALRLTERSLCIRTGVAGQRIGDIDERIFASHPEHALVYISEGESPYGCRIGLDNLTGGETERVRADVPGRGSILWRARAWERLHCEEHVGVELTGRLELASDGEVDVKGEFLEVRKATWIGACLYMETDYPKRMGRERTAGPGGANSVAESRRILEEMYEEHVRDVVSIMERCDLHLPGQEKTEFLFQYGRYLLLSSVREDSLLPPHLQGIWNDNVACRIGWTCDMHLDINTQMNYWPALPTGLEETLPPLWDWMEHTLIPEGRKTAEKAYGMPGWVGELVSNAWGYSAPYWATPLAPCPTGGIWLLTQLWQQYLYTGEGELPERLLPLYQEAVSFFEAYLFEQDGQLMSGPSISPENTFRAGGKDYQISLAPTYEILMIRELFLEYRQILEKMPSKEKQWANMSAHAGRILSMLPAYRILKDGTLAEYMDDVEVPDKQHRHTSHLLGVYPFRQIQREKDEELAEAVIRTMKQKTHPAEGWEDTGWARSLLALYEARLGRGNEAAYHLGCLISGLLEPNHMIYHPPTRGAGAFDHVYELDGNTGFTAAVAEMLVQGHEGILRLLPALPQGWDRGSVRGLRARGGILVDISWEKGRVREFQLLARRDASIELHYNGQKERMELIGGRTSLRQIEKDRA